MKYSVILTVYGRQMNFFDQIESLNSQLIPPSEIFVFIDRHLNKSSLEIVEYCKKFNIQTFIVTNNVGVWGRFAVTLLTCHEYIFILDDDVIPGNYWFSNCLNIMSNRKCVVGGVGVLFEPNTNDYTVSKRIGWVNPLDTDELADVVGHIWGAPREFFQIFWSFSNDHFKFPRSGEDIHFSWRAKQSGYDVVVPYHGEDKKNWANVKGVFSGLDQEALSLEPSSVLRMASYLKKVRKIGFTYVLESDESKTIRPINKSIKIDRGYIFFIKNRINVLFKWMKN